MKIYNSRGMVSKNLDEGGAQERELAARYARYSNAMAAQWPQAVLPDEAREYIYQRLWDVLSGKDKSEPFSHLTPAQRQSVHAMLRKERALWEARKRGVIFDVGHAGGHFDFNLVQRAMGEGIIPDVISSELHGRLSQPGFGVVGDLPTVLTKFLPMGLSFDDIIAKCTVDAARVIGWQDRIGSLEASAGHVPMR